MACPGRAGLRSQGLALGNGSEQVMAPHRCIRGGQSISLGSSETHGLDSRAEGSVGVCGVRGGKCSFLLPGPNLPLVKRQELPKSVRIWNSLV